MPYPPEIKYEPSTLIDLSRIPDGWYLYKLQDEHEHGWDQEAAGNLKGEERVQAATVTKHYGWRCELQRKFGAGSLVSNVVDYHKTGWTDSAQEAIDLAIKEVEDGIKNKRWNWCK